MAAQLEVFRFVDHTHPAAAELRENAIMRDGFTDHVEERLSRGILGRACRRVNAPPSCFIFRPQLAGTQRVPESLPTGTMRRSHMLWHRQRGRPEGSIRELRVSQR